VIAVYIENPAQLVSVPDIILMLITRQHFFALIAKRTIAAWVSARISLLLARYWLPRYLKKLKPK
jgi:hypothetical protein